MFIKMQSLEDNERNISFWEAYVNDLNALDFSILSGKLTVPVLVPIGNKIFFRGFLKHTNEVTVSLGADYFAKCSIKQAEIIKQHRIKDAQSKLDLYKKEKDYLENQLNLNKTTHHSVGQDIIETCTEEEDRIWKEKHKEKVKLYNQSKKKHLDECDNELTDDELWSRLEELELQEELEEEYFSMTNGKNHVEADNLVISKDDIPTKLNPLSKSKQLHEVDGVPDHSNNSESKAQILEQIMIRQKNLELKLAELQNKKEGNSKTEEDLLEKLNEIDQLDELEDEMNRLDDILNEDSDDSEKTTEEITSLSSRKTVTFANDDDSKTLQISLKHSDVEPDTAPYNPTNGIKKPSDIYEAFSSKLPNETTSILKNTKYGNNDIKTSDENKYIASPEIETQRETIVVKDVLEKAEENNKLYDQLRPVSLFKKRRQIKK
ncbi:unconventional prefoldin RPB5 interactor isoform X2 [Pieris rapae]|uniref:unconventional prefoldin RPB5 interactor isoform X2 n=1 Tax=Pieris rapae TaxID=64459 RepID=UPI001E27B96A|nr:unconventional prefoldin RPB5 interactor isoform X2 [Pieris rapae]